MLNTVRRKYSFRLHAHQPTSPTNTRTWDFEYCDCFYIVFSILQKAVDDKAGKGKKGPAKPKKEEKDPVPAENGETKVEEVR